MTRKEKAAGAMHPSGFQKLHHPDYTQVWGSAQSVALPAEIARVSRQIAWLREVAGRGRAGGGIVKTSAYRADSQPASTRYVDARSKLVPAMTNGRRIREEQIARATPEEALGLAEHHLRDAVRASVTETIAWLRDELVRHTT